jgi:ParB family transcriptional regulator, chromosome partitioning protein
MDIENIDITKLYVSNVNARKTLTGVEDETGISDLANDISTNGLINPITVRKIGEQYEIIAGQRRYLAMRTLNKTSIPCNVLKVDTQKAEELSLVENVQRNQMTTGDKVRSYSKLYETYNKDIDKVVSSVHVSKNTIQKYLKIKDLPSEIINMLDASGKDKISIDVAIELSKLPETVDLIEVLDTINEMTNDQKTNAIKQFRKKGCDIESLSNIKDEIVIQANNIPLSEPYVFDEKTNENIIIPQELYGKVVRLIKDYKNKK